MKHDDWSAMIIGLGSDLCNIERIQNSLDRFGKRFENRVFNEKERAKAARRPFTKAGTYAKRFAAKEAISKALGTGIAKGVGFQQMAIHADELGKPLVELSGEALNRARSLSGQDVLLSLSDEGDMIVAFAVLT